MMSTILGVRGRCLPNAVSVGKLDGMSFHMVSKYLQVLSFVRKQACDRQTIDEWMD